MVARGPAGCERKRRREVQGRGRGDPRGERGCGVRGKWRRRGGLVTGEEILSDRNQMQRNGDALRLRV